MRLASPSHSISLLIEAHMVIQEGLVKLLSDTHPMADLAGSGLYLETF